MGVDTDSFGSRYYVENYFDQGKRKVILFVGRLVEFKGTRYLIDAMKYIKNAKLVIVGKGEEERALRASAAKLKKQINDNGSDLVFLGAKNHEELKTIYASSDIFVLPGVEARDRSKEGLGLVMLETLASGLPVVASNVGGIPSVIKNGNNGILVPERQPELLAEAITGVLEYDSLRAELRKA